MIYAAFDIGNVLCNVDFEPVIQMMMKQHKISTSTAISFFTDLHKHHDLGFVDIKSKLKEFYTDKTDAILKAWNECVIPNKEMINLLNELYQSGVEIALLSNIGFEHRDYLNDLLKNEPGYRNAIKWFSCDVGARKPQALYYQSFLLQYPEFKGCFYFDDVEENFEAGYKFGFASYQFALTDYFKSEIPTTSSKSLIYKKIKEDNLISFAQEVDDIKSLILVK